MFTVRAKLLFSLTILLIWVNKSRIKQQLNIPMPIWIACKQCSRFPFDSPTAKNSHEKSMRRQTSFKRRKFAFYYMFLLKSILWIQCSNIKWVMSKYFLIFIRSVSAFSENNWHFLALNITHGHVICFVDNNLPRSWQNYVYFRGQSLWMFLGSKNSVSLW